MGFNADRIRIGHFSCGRNQIPFRQAFVQNPAEICVFVGIDTNCLKRIDLRASNLADGDVVFLQLLPQILDRLVRLAANRIVGHNLQDELSAATKV